MNLLATPHHLPRSGDDIVWSVEGKPLVVHLNRELILQLQAAISQCDFDGGRRFEMGGILLGRVTEPDVAGRHTVFVDEYLSVECEHVRGASWTLSKADKHELGARLLRLNRPGGDRTRVVGWFRTHTRPGLYLDEHDLKLFQEYFEHPEHVCLLIRPSVGTTSETAGFFFWEEGEIQRSQCYKTFEFPAFIPPRAPEPAPRKSTPEPHHTQVASTPAASANGRSAATVPQPVRRMDPRRTRWILWAPVALGLIAGVLWSPNPLRKDKARVPVVPSGDQSGERPVFTLPDFPSAITPTPDPAEGEPISSVPDETRARTTATHKPVRKFEAAPVRSTPLARPTFVESAPKIAAIRASSVPALKFETVPLLAAVSVEPPKPSAIRRALGSIPGFGFLKRKKASSSDFTPAKPVRQVRPVSPDELKTEVPVRIRLTIDQRGEIAGATVLGYADSKLAQSALDAAKRWQFEPARVHDEPVVSEVILRFRFAPGSSEI